MPDALLSLDDVRVLSKTKAAKLLQAAVRDSQNTPRASYKSELCPSWWIAGQIVQLPDGSDAVAAPFANPRHLSLDELHCALHLWYSSQRLAVGEKPGNEKEEHQVEPHHESHFEQPHPSPVPPPNPPKIRSNRSRAKKRAPANASKSEPKECSPPVATRTTRRTRGKLPNSYPEDNLDCSDADVPDDKPDTDPDTKDHIKDDPDKKDKKESPAAQEVALDDSVDDDRAIVDRHEKRVAYLNQLKARLKDLKVEATGSLAKHEKDGDRFVADMKNRQNMKIFGVDRDYRQRLMAFPKEFLDLEMVDVVQHCNLDKNIWLHASIEAATEKVYRGSDATDRAQGESDDDDTPMGLSLPPKTPPAPTPAARTRRDDILKTVQKTAQRMRRQRAMEETEEEEHAPHASQSQPGVRKPLSKADLRTDADPLMACSTKTPARLARIGEVMYSANDSPIQTIARNRHIRAVPPAQGQHVGAAGGMPVELLRAANIGAGLTQTMRKCGDQRRYVKEVEAWLNTTKQELDEHESPLGWDEAVFFFFFGWFKT